MELDPWSVAKLRIDEEQVQRAEFTQIFTGLRHIYYIVLRQIDKSLDRCTKCSTFAGTMTATLLRNVAHYVLAAIIYPVSCTRSNGALPAIIQPSLCPNTSVSWAATCNIFSFSIWEYAKHQEEVEDRLPRGQNVMWFPWEVTWHMPDMFSACYCHWEKSDA